MILILFRFIKRRK